MKIRKAVNLCLLLLPMAGYAQMTAPRPRFRKGSGTRI